VLSLLEAENFKSESRKELLKILLKEKSVLQKAATEETPEQRETARAKEEEKSKSKRDGKKGGKKSKQEKARHIGNTGTKLILKLLEE
jgi:pumilio family protein 6